MIRLSENEAIILNGHDSRGIQMKFKKENMWYKTDFAGYQGLAESVVSNVLSHSNIESFVRYKEEEIEYRGAIFNGCISENFKPEETDIVTVSKLFQTHYGKPVMEICQERSLENTIYNFVEKTAKVTGLKEDEIGKYITTILELDALILNDDRHFNNIAFLKCDDVYVPAPLFDHGSSLLSDEIYYPSNTNTEDLISKVHSKTFSDSFAEQKNAAESLFGHQLQLYTDDIEKFLPACSIYDEAQINRVENILEIQLERYRDLVRGTLEQELALANESVRGKRECVEREYGLER